MRRLLLATLFLVAFLASLAGGLVLVRHEAAEMAVRQVLASEGIGNASFTVSALGWESAELTDVTLGRYQNIRARRIEVRFGGLEGWAPWVWSPAVQEVRIEGLRLDLNQEGGGGPLNDPDLDRLLSGPEEAEVSEASEIPPILIEDAAVTLVTVDGRTRLLLNGSIVRPQGEALAGQFDYAIATPLGQAEGAIELLQGPDEPLRVTATAESASLELDEMRIDELSAAIELILSEDELPRASGQIAIRGFSPLAGYVEEMTIALEADPTRMNLDLSARAPGGAKVGSGRIAITRLDSRPQINADLTVNAVKASSRLGLLEERGELTIQSRLTATLPPLVDLIHDRGGKAIQLLESASLAARLNVTAKGLTVPQKVLGLDGELHLEVLLEDARLRSWVSKESRLTVAALDPELPLLALLPEDTRRALWRNLAVTLPLAGEAGLQASARRSEEGIDVTLQGPIALTGGVDTEVSFSGRLDSRLDDELEPLSLAVRGLDLRARALPIYGNRITSLTLTGDGYLDPDEIAGDLILDARLAEGGHEDLLVQGIEVRLPVRLSTSERQTRVTLDEKGAIRLAGASYAGDPVLRSPAAFAIERIAIAREGSAGWQPRLALTAQSLDLALPGDATPLDLRGLTLELTGLLEDGDLEGELQVKAERVALPREGVSLSFVEMTLPLPPDRLETQPATIEVADAALSADGQRFGGMTLSASLQGRNDRYRLTGKGRGPNGQGRIAVSLQHDLASERGSLEASWGPITFAPKGLQPKALSQELADLEAVSGEVSIEAKGEWSPQSSNIAARVQLKSLSATLLPARIEGLSGELNFPSLSPLVTLKDQQVTIEKLDVGVPLSDLLLGFEVVDAQGGPALNARTLQADFAGGRLEASPFRIAGPDSVFSTTIEVAHVKLDRLASLLDLGDIKLEGRVIGQIPLTLDLGKETLAIEGGWLQAVDEGVIRIPNAAERLGLGGVSKEQKDLLFALDALADFHYTYLYAKVSFAADGKLDLALTLEGNNPAVLEGHPFKFNVNFGVNLTELLAAFRRGRAITPELFDGAWSLK